MRSAARVGVTTAAAFIVSLLWVQPATAERFVHPDPSGDMVKEAEGSPGLVHVAHRHNLDIRRVVVRHLAHRVRIRVEFDRLYKPSRPAFENLYGIEGFARVNRKAMPWGTFRGGPWEWELTFSSKHPHKPAFFGVSDAQDEELVGCFDPASSRGLRARISYRDDFMVASYPRHCFAPFGLNIRPKWIRMSATSHQAILRHLESPAVNYFDHWIKPDNASFLSWHRHYFLSPRLHPGESAR